MIQKGEKKRQTNELAEKLPHAIGFVEVGAHSTQDFLVLNDELFDLAYLTGHVPY